MAGDSSNAPAAPTPGRKDDELTELLTKLYSMQEDIGAKPKTTEEEKKAKAANVAVMGKGKKAEKKGSRFLELKSSIVDRLKTIHSILKETKDKEKAGFGGDNAKEIIKMQAEVRELIRLAGDEWNEIDAIYKKVRRWKQHDMVSFRIQKAGRCKRLLGTTHVSRLFLILGSAQKEE